MPQSAHSTGCSWWWEDKRDGQGLCTFNRKWSKNFKSDLDFQSWKYIHWYKRIEHILFSKSLAWFNLSRDPQPLGSNAWWSGGITDVIIIEIKWTINVMWLNHPETIPASPLHEKSVFQETGLWTKNVGDHCLKLCHVGFYCCFCLGHASVGSGLSIPCTSIKGWFFIAFMMTRIWIWSVVNGCFFDMCQLIFLLMRLVCSIP